MTLKKHFIQNEISFETFRKFKNRFQEVDKQNLIEIEKNKTMHFEPQK
jgi:hypothetical protein